MGLIRVWLPDDHNCRETYGPLRFKRSTLLHMLLGVFVAVNSFPCPWTVPMGHERDRDQDFPTPVQMK